MNFYIGLADLCYTLKTLSCLISLIPSVETFDEKKEKVAFNQFATMVVGAGGFGGAKSSESLIPLQKPPTRAPDSSMAERTSVDSVSDQIFRDCKKFTGHNCFFVLCLW